VQIEDEDDSKFSRFSNQDKMHYKIFSAQALCDIEKYDLIVRLRPDKLFAPTQQPLDWPAILDASRQEQTIFTDDNLCFRENLVIGDQFAVGAPELMRIYADAWQKMPTMIAENWYEVPDQFVGHSSLAYNLLNNGIHSRKCPGIEPLRPVDCVQMEAEQIISLIQQSLNTRPKTRMDDIFCRALGI
jgi:hypothetical protein